MLADANFAIVLGGAVVVAAGIVGALLPSERLSRPERVRSEPLRVREPAGAEPLPT